jgi:hypothetical protein
VPFDLIAGGSLEGASCLSQFHSAPGKASWQVPK